MNRLDYLRRALAKNGRTQLGVGPMSEACVDAVIEVANEHALPLLLIGSRRQIECAEQGGGYVNGWTTESFANYVRERDRGGYVLLCRDHGGPWQNYPEVAQRMSVRDAMASAKASFDVDLRSGYDVIHIDPSEMPGGAASPAAVLELLFELYDHVVETARKLEQPILIEVGTEEQNGGLNTPEEVDTFLRQLGAFCERRHYEMPVFVVVQTGTLVRETRNVGRFVIGLDAEQATAAHARIRDLVVMTRHHGIFIKEHNGDYLPHDVLSKRPELGIGATNVAPEFGIAETQFLLDFCEEAGLAAEAEQFLALAYGTGKWQKWLVPESRATDRDKAVMAGHYAYALPEFRSLLGRLRAVALRRGLDLDRAVRDHLKSAILRIARPLGLVAA